MVVVVSAASASSLVPAVAAYSSLSVPFFLPLRVFCVFPRGGARSQRSLPQFRSRVHLAYPRASVRRRNLVPSAPEGAVGADRTSGYRSGAGEDFHGIPPAAACCGSSVGSNRLTGDSDA